MAKGDVLVRMKADVSNYDANIAKARGQLERFKNDNLTLGGVLKQTQGTLLTTAARFASVTAAVGALGSAFMDNIATARKFEVSMSQLSSLTGMVGEDLGKLKEYAIELGSSTTLSASQVADAFKMIGSQQPQLLESGEALKAVTKNAITLAEAAGIDLATAAQTLSTSINQMGGDSGNAERYINVLAAASQKGAGDIAWLGEAITKSGTTAKAVGTDYEELVANLEQLAKAGFDASTAGTALRSIIMNLEKQANNDFKPSVVGLTQAFENLGKANLDIVGYQEMAGKMFASQAKALADAAGEAKSMTAAITGTNTAEEQAKTNTDNLEGSIKALSSAWEGFNLHLNSSNGIFRAVVDGLKDIVVWADKAILSIGEIPNPEKSITSSLPEAGANVDDKGNYIKRPAQKGAVGFDWSSGTWKQGYTGAIYNSATGQTEFPDIEIVGRKPTQGGGGKETKSKSIKLTPGQQAVVDIQKAEQDYANAIKNAQQKLVENIMKSDEYDRQVLSGQQQLADAYLKAYNATGDEKYLNSFRETAQHVLEMQGVVDAATKAQKESEQAAREQAAAQKKLATAQEEAAEAIKDNDLKGLYAANKKIIAAGGQPIAARASDATERIQDQKEMNAELGFSYTSSNLDAFITSLKEKLSNADMGSELAKSLNSQLADANALGNIMQVAIKNGIDVSQFNPQDIWKKVFGDTPGDFIEDTTWQSIEDTVNAKLKELGIKPIKINVDTGALEDANNDAKESQKQFSAAAGAIKSVAGAMQSIEDPTAKVMGMIAEAVASIALGFSQAIGKDVGSKGNVWYGIATAAAGIASMVSTIASIHSATGYAQGGVIPGNYYSNDMQYARVNAGETILTRAQAGNLVSQLEGGGLGNLRLSATISGEQIRLALNNNGRRTGRGEYVTTNFVRS